jgi:hypothetical protein
MVSPTTIDGFFGATVMANGVGAGGVGLGSFDEHAASQAIATGANALR